ncbi:hypothetical protein SEA_RASPUTIA_116 [Microbacterium phage Rasputia]|nr:hypothetical protein SEA_RASPUTIA_116 [Microbacterium phage Rasputia]
MSEITQPDRKRSALNEVEYAAQSLKNALEGVKRDVDRALLAMHVGHMPDRGHGVGPIGHQAPFDVAKATVTLSGKVELARAYGATDAEIEAAYQTGAMK